MRWTRLKPARGRSYGRIIAMAGVIVGSIVKTALSPIIPKIYTIKFQISTTHVRSPTRSKFGNKSPMVVNPKSKTTRITDKKGECNTTPPRGEPPPLLLLAAALVLALVLFCAGSRLSAALSATTAPLHISSMEHASSLLSLLLPLPSLSPPLRHNRWASQQVGPLPTDLPYSITCCGFACSTRVR